MEWTVLGFQSPFPGPGGATPGYLLTTRTGQHILIDCGSGVMSVLPKYLPAHKLDAVILSHLHHDHMVDILTLQYALDLYQLNGIRSEPLPVYAPDEPACWWEKLHYKTVTKPRLIDEQSVIETGGVRIQFHRTDHGILCYAMEISDGLHTILYGADSGPRTNWEAMCQEPDLFICEATFLDRQIPEDEVPHLSARQAAEAAEQLGAKQLLLTHLYPENDPNQLLREAAPHYSGTLHIAREGWKMSL